MGFLNKRANEIADALKGGDVDQASKLIKHFADESGMSAAEKQKFALDLIKAAEPKKK